MTNLRQQITEILGISELHDGIRCKCSSCRYKRKQSDRICEAIKAKVEGMPIELIDNSEYDEYAAFDKGKRQQYEACKSYLMGELR